MCCVMNPRFSMKSYLLPLFVFFTIIIIILFIFLFLTNGLPDPQSNLNHSGSFGSFWIVDKGICTDSGRPIIRLYSSSWCTHCEWISETYDDVVRDYIVSDKVIAYHWSLDEKDDLLTDEMEDEIPLTELALLLDYNPRNSVPTFIFGCKYYRIGTGYEYENDLSLEDSEFRAIIEDLLASTT